MGLVSVLFANVKYNVVMLYSEMYVVEKLHNNYTSYTISSGSVNQQKNNSNTNQNHGDAFES